MFMFRAGQDFKLLFLDSRVSQITGYEPQDLVDRTLYHYVHTQDLMALRWAHQVLLTKGQVTTRYYRFLTRNGGWIWMQSYATLVHNSRSSRPEVIVSVNHALSDVEAKHLNLSIDQVEKTPSDYIRSAQALATLTANSVENDKCPTANTSLNSSASSISHRNCTNKILKTKCSIKQRDVEAKHLNLSIDQVEKTPSDYIRSAQALATLTANSVENDKCPTANTSLNSSASSISHRNCTNKILKTKCSIKQRKSSPKLLTKNEILPSPTILTDGYSSIPANTCYPHDDIYYNSHHPPPPQTNYSNFPPYPSSTAYTNPTCFSTYSNPDDDNNKSSSLPIYNSMYYDQQSNDYHSTTKMIPSKQQQQQQPSHQIILDKKKQIAQTPLIQQHIKQDSSGETLSLCSVNNKRIRLDNESIPHHHHHHLSNIDYETNLPSDKIDFYPPTNNCYVSTNYPTEHPYHHTSVIVDSQQYFLNGWNGATAF
ncbi:unnamed protein product [Adineta steineri]|uniref:PAS domain-containing protein n=1 Tax=Adineta steineri TaxID=433720 RepID=A0A815FNC0_9BILA|nr:unnamed protein product [Adineta steineri]